MLNKLITPFHYGSDSTEVLEFITELTKRHCLKSEWLSIKAEFHAFYTTDQINTVKARINKEGDFECEFVVRLLNQMYIWIPGLSSTTARKVAKNVAERCGCSAEMSF